jgi:Cu/Ag efflux pump CusA
MKLIKGLAFWLGLPLFFCALIIVLVFLKLFPLDGK